LAIFKHLEKVALPYFTTERGFLHCVGSHNCSEKLNRKVKTMKQKMTEERFVQLTATGFSDEEKYMLRKVFDLPVGEIPTVLSSDDDMSKAFFKSVLMRALVKLPKPEDSENAKPSKPSFPDENDPAMQKVLVLVDEVGLGRSCLMGGAVILEGGVADIMKACSVPAFRHAITGGTGFINRAVAQENMLPGRRVLLAHIIEKLKTLGAVIKKQELCHALTVDEVHEFSLDGRDISLCLMPR